METLNILAVSKANLVTLHDALRRHTRGEQPTDLMLIALATARQEDRMTLAAWKRLTSDQKLILLHDAISAQETTNEELQEAANRARPIIKTEDLLTFRWHSLKFTSDDILLNYPSSFIGMILSDIP